MPQNPAYKQLLTLITARSLQWLRGRIEQMPMAPLPGSPAITDLANIAVVANICSGFRGSEAPLQTFLRSRFTSSFIETFILDFQCSPASSIYPGSALLRFLPSQDLIQILPGARPLPERLALSDLSCRNLLAEAAAFLRRPVPEECLTDDTIDTYARVLGLCYRFGEERPRFDDVRTYGDAYANCLRFADWAQRKGHLVPLAQMGFCLCLIDPDHDIAPMLADVISSQRPDGSFPTRLGFGTADQDGAALQPTLAALAALQIATHGRWHGLPPSVPLAA